MEIWFECTTSGQRCAAEVGEGCSAADLQERAVAVLYPQSVVSAEAVGLCVDGADGEVLAPEVLIARTALCAGGTVYVRKQDSSGVWVPRRYAMNDIQYSVQVSFGDVCEDTLVLGGEHAVSINLVTTEVTPLPPVGSIMSKVVLMPHHIVYSSARSNAVYFRPRDSGAEVVVRMAGTVERLVAMRVTETVLIGTSEHIVQYSCEGVKMRTIDQCGCSFAVSPCETLLLSNHPAVVVYRLNTPELREVHRVDTGMGVSFFLQPSFSPDSSLAVLSCGDNHTVRTIDIVSGRALCTLPTGEHEIRGACFSACSRYLFTVTLKKVQQWDARSGAPMGCTQVNFAWSVHASTDGRRLVVVGSAISVLDIAAINMQVSEQDALQHGPPRPLLIPRTKRSVASRESRCRCVFVKGKVSALVEGAWADCKVTHSAAYDAPQGANEKSRWQRHRCGQRRDGRRWTTNTGQWGKLYHLAGGKRRNRFPRLVFLK